ncbi:uncharacterized protein STEHIDRAFT_148606 [Stereum hirsutum FP-91666 SS1]|uniref:uncharacterized protein n=1 Tax=Stereum hirsutum (strain FP-91666) TaxID=721885 RepID=UPI000444A4B2|nr:uncharacterized protein STEHIDRAFT_148606 [Stereum hirsutum FP-91666 SS1]EIM83805.1 hypothetical protein STEHIDRAFT_148606 [Stereum hirsutum FP-91666 SS1]
MLSFQRLAFLLATAISLGSTAWATPLASSSQASLVSSRSEPDPSFAVSVELGGVTYVNKGLVAFGLIPSDFVDSTGDTMGGFGSAIALQAFSKSSSGDRSDSESFTGTLVVQPDRGFNVDGTINYQARQHTLAFTLTPYYDPADLSFSDAQSTLQLTYLKTLLYTEREDKNTTGLDALGVRPAGSGETGGEGEDPVLPIASEVDDRLSLDCEGLVSERDGTFWMSDEYGPYIYKFSSSGSLIKAIQPSAAILPLDKKGNVNFTSAVDPKTGRAVNQGFEGLTTDSSHNTLYALLQSATIQDGGDDDMTSRYTRLVAFDVSSSSTASSFTAANVTSSRSETATGTVTGEWVVPLPTSKKGKTRAASELHYVSEGVFFVLSRDGKGHGDDDDDASYKQADLISLANATDIHGSKFDDPANPIADDGKLDKSIVPATYVSFVDYLDDVQLARFGLHNGDPSDQTLINAKWESLALASCQDEAFPDDYFLFTVSDNDFITTNGTSLGQPYDAGLDNDNQFLVFRVTLPGAALGDLPAI